eukprot:sb/3472137/
MCNILLNNGRLANNPPSLPQVCLAFTLGLKLFTEGHTTTQFLVSLTCFVMSCPIGIISGALVIKYLSSTTLANTVFILKALATGIDSIFIGACWNFIDPPLVIFLSFLFKNSLPLSGTFVQVTFFEILAPEFAERYANQLHKMAAVILGFLLISLTMYLLHDIPMVDFCKV